MRRNSMVESGSLDGIDNGINLDDFFDFSVEGLEGSGTERLEGDWDDVMYPCLEPIPSEVFQDGLASISNNCLNVLPNLSVPSEETSQSKELKNESSSPVSVLESSRIPAPICSTRPRPSTFKSGLKMPLSSDLCKKMPNHIKRKSKKKKLSQLSGAMVMKEKSLQQPGATVMKEKSLQQPVGAKKCTHCEITTTPLWRQGPMGRKTLCNACGVRYRAGHLFPEYRPVASPTFVPSLHSNSHKKVIEMRNRVSQESAVPETDPGLSPPPEFVPMNSYLFDCILGGSGQYS